MKRMALVGASLVALLLPVGAAPVASASPASTGDAEATVKVWSPDGVLRSCAGHGYRYAVDVPAGDSWSVEVHLVNRHGKTRSFGYALKGADPKKGKGRFQFCSRDLRPGKYKVKAELIGSHYSDEYHVWAKPRTIRLRRP